MNIDDHAEAVSESKGIGRQDADKQFLKDLKLCLGAQLVEGGLMGLLGLSTAGCLVFSLVSESEMVQWGNLGVGGLSAGCGVWIYRDFVKGSREIYQRATQYLSDPAAYLKHHYGSVLNDSD